MSLTYGIPRWKAATWWCTIQHLRKFGKISAGVFISLHIDETSKRQGIEQAGRSGVVLLWKRMGSSPFGKYLKAAQAHIELYVHHSRSYCWDYINENVRFLYFHTQKLFMSDYMHWLLKGRLEQPVWVENPCHSLNSCRYILLLRMNILNDDL